jgi:hypothetical protein
MNSNRNSEKSSENENRTGSLPENASNHKLPDNQTPTDEDSVSTHGDSSNGKYSKTNKRDDEVDNNNVRGGS